MKLFLLNLLIISFNAISLEYDFSTPTCKKFTQYHLEKFPDINRGSIETLDKRLEALVKEGNLHSFMRAFPGYFHLMLQNDLATTPVAYSEIRHVEGLILGDAHVENFGLVTDGYGDRIFAYNDFDDSGYGAIISDLMRLYISANFVEQKQNGFDFTRFINTYVDGLLGLETAQPRYINKMFRDSKKAEKKMKKDYKRNILYKEKDTPYDKLYKIKSTPAIFEVASFNRGELPALMYRRDKLEGGSGGLPRYYFIIKKEKEVIRQEIKYLARYAGSHYWDKEKNSDHARNSQKAMTAFLGQQFAAVIRASMFNSQAFIERVKSPANLSIETYRLMNKKGKQLEEVINYEFYTLAKHHLKTLNTNDQSRMVKILKQMIKSETGVQEFQVSADYIKSNLAKVFKSCKTYFTEKGSLTKP